ncbi:hypothetical protein ACVW0I_006014 [Bradyrhizobium sp. LM6.11]
MNFVQTDISPIKMRRIVSVPGQRYPASITGPSDTTRSNTWRSVRMLPPFYSQASFLGCCTKFKMRRLQVT